MSATRKLAAILVADVVGYSRLAGADEDRTLARLRGLRSDLIDPAVAAHHGRVVKRTGDGSIIARSGSSDAAGDPPPTTQFGSSRYASLVPALFGLTALAQHCFLESVGGQSRRRYRPDLEQPPPKKTASKLMIGSWKIGAQLSTSHSFRDSLDPLGMVETVRRVQKEIDLDLLIVGFREAPQVFQKFCGPDRPVGDSILWYGALSDIEGMDGSDLVVNWRGERSRGWGGWAEKGGEVDETFRFVCPNNPAVRRKTVGRLRDLLDQYDFAGVFLDKIRFPSPANGVDEMLSCFCGHCRDAAKGVGLDLDSVVKILADGAIDPWTLRPEAARDGNSSWLDALVAGSPILSHFLRFRADSVAALVAELAEQARRMGRKVSLDLFSPCLAPLVGQDYRVLKQHCDWAKPMTYRLALGPAGLRLEIPALIEGVASRFGLDEARIVEWSARHAAFDKDALHETRERAVPISFIQAEIEAAVRTLAPAPVYFGLELVRQPGVIGVDRRHVVDMVKAGRAANAAGLVISWDLMHAPIDCVRALAEAA